MIRNIICLLLCLCLCLAWGTVAAVAEEALQHPVILEKLERVIDMEAATAEEQALVEAVRQEGTAGWDKSFLKATWGVTTEGQRVLTVAMCEIVWDAALGSNSWNHWVYVALDEKGDHLQVHELRDGNLETLQQAWERQLGQPFMQWPLAIQYAFSEAHLENTGVVGDESLCLIGLDEALRLGIDALNAAWDAGIDPEDSRWTTGRELYRNEAQTLTSASLMWIISVEGEDKQYQVNVSAIDGSVLLMDNGEGGNG